MGKKEEDPIEFVRKTNKPKCFSSYYLYKTLATAIVMAAGVEGKHKLEESGWAEHAWFLNDDDYNGVIFWIKEEDYELVSYNEITDEATVEWKGPSVEFRHGHYGNKYWWWVDFYLEHWLATHLEGVIIDEGTGVIQQPDLEQAKKRLSFFSWKRVFRNLFCRKRKRRN